ncbi:hypothetical protein GCM10027578_15180 [Spirosoma luteolum]
MVLRILSLALLLTAPLVGARAQSASRWQAALPQQRLRSLSLAIGMAPSLTSTGYRRQTLYPESNGQLVEPVWLDSRRTGIGFGAGATVYYTYAPGWSVGAGLWYHQQTIRQLRRPVAGPGTTLIRSRALRLPLSITFQPGTQRLSPLFTLGLLTDFGLPTQLVARRGSEPTQYLRVAQSINPTFQASVGAGAAYRLGRQLTVQLQPTLIYGVGQFGGATTFHPTLELALQTQALWRF